MITTMNRLLRLETARGKSTEPTPLLILYSHGHGPDDLVAVSGLDQMPRLPRETGHDFVGRLQAFVSKTRTGASPFIGFARYQHDED